LQSDKEIYTNILEDRFKRLEQHDPILVGIAPPEIVALLKSLIET
jgi:hypothetical protein